MAAESIHQKLSRVRKPHVHITYEVETEGAVEEKELPFVVGVIGDFSGNPTQPLRPHGRPQVHSDRSRQLQRRHGPHDAGAELPRRKHAEGGRQRNGGAACVQVALKTSSRAGWSSRSSRSRSCWRRATSCATCLSTVDRSDKLEEQLEEILKNTEKTQALAKEVGVESTPSNTSGGE